MWKRYQNGGRENGQEVPVILQARGNGRLDRANENGKGVHKDTPGDNWGDLNTDMGAWKDTDIFGK